MGGVGALISVTCLLVVVGSLPSADATPPNKSPPAQPALSALQSQETNGSVAVEWVNLERVAGQGQGTPPSPHSLINLTLAGYQGWFATPNDTDDNGWIHWGPLADGHGIQEDFWPEMSEFTPAEQHPAPGYTNADGTQAHLFSSDNAATVLRHFQWMEAYGVDGVALQRFDVEVGAIRHKCVP